MIRRVRCAEEAGAGPASCRVPPAGPVMALSCPGDAAHHGGSPDGGAPPGLWLTASEPEDPTPSAAPDVTITAFRNGYRADYDVASDDAFRQLRMAHP